MHHRISLILISLLMLLNFKAFSQDRCPAPGISHAMVSPMDTVGDFTIITTERDTLNLYATLAEGKTVFLDLFYTRCGFCQLYAPIIDEIYQNTGNGEEDTVFWGISNDPYDTDPIIDAYKTEYGVTNPCAGPQGGGIQALTIIIEGQNFLGYPTYCVVCPDRIMFFDPCYPPTITGFDPFFEYCSDLVGTPEILAGNDVAVSIYPNPASGPVTLEIQLAGGAVVETKVVDFFGRIVLESNGYLEPGSHDQRIDFSELEEGNYLVKVTANGQPAEMLKVLVMR